ncbi:MAG: hypothetical protein RL199_30 [Pseudomonadota bacterium]|jgi:hypothetical protein
MSDEEQTQPEEKASTKAKAKGSKKGAGKPESKHRYRKISTRMWADARFLGLSTPPPNGQSLWLYLLTGPHTNNIPGLFVAGEAMLAEALGWDVEGFREAFAELSSEVVADDLSEAQAIALRRRCVDGHSDAMVKVDWNHRVVFLPASIKHNEPASPNVVKGWRVAWSEVPDCPLKLQAWESLHDALKSGLGDKFATAFSTSCPRPRFDLAKTSKAKRKASAKTRANQEQEQEQEQEQGERQLLCDPPAAVAEADEDFGPAPVEQTQPPTAVATTQPTDRKPRQPKLVLTGEAPSSRKPANPEHAQIVADMGRWLDRYRVWRNDPKATVPFPVFAQAWKARGIDDLLLALDGLRDDDFAKSCGPKALLSGDMIAKGVNFARNGTPRPSNHAEGTLQIARAMVGAVRDWTPPEDY